MRRYSRSVSMVRIEPVALVDVAQDIKKLLYEHLYKPWGVDPDFDWFSASAGGEFLVARNKSGVLLGTVRIMPTDDNSPGHPIPEECANERRLRQVLVDPAMRGRGIGLQLMQAAEARVVELGADRVGLASRYQAYDFYQRCGYRFYGEEYISRLTHIPHRHMSKEL